MKASIATYQVKGFETMKRYSGMLSWMNDNLDNVKDSHPTEMSANCPFCQSKRGSPDTKGHLYVSKVSQVAHCFRCDWSGSYISLIMKIAGCSYSEALSRLSNNPLLENYREAIEEFIYDSEVVEDPIIVTEDSSPFPENYITLDRSDSNMTYNLAVKYLRHRRIGEDFIFSGMFGIVPGVLRVFIQASDIYWQARALMKFIEPKYLNPRIDVFDILGLWDISGLREYLDSGSSDLYVCEGLFSAFAMINRGKPAIALLGKTAREEQLRRLCELDKHLIIMMDSDAKENSWNIAEKLCEIGKPDVSVAILEDGDPDTCDQYEIHSVNWKNKAKWRLQA